MVVLLDENARVLVQGITGRYGKFHAEQMMKYGTKILAGVTPGKGGQEVLGVPVFDTVAEAKERFPELNASIIFVPAGGAADAIIEAADAGMKLIVVITEGIPVHDALKAIRYARRKGSTVIGPNCPGIISPGKSKLGIMPHQYFAPGRIGIVSRSGTLTYEIAYQLTKSGLGQSTAIGIGGDPIIGLDTVEAVRLFDEDPDTDLIVVIGEIGGDAEERLAQVIKRGEIKKPIVAYIAGRTAPPGKRMGHAGAIISMGSGTAESKVRALREAGVPVADIPSQVVDLVKEVLKR
ncbi:succinyl-CoA synthetase subunit alpha [Ignicoccus islandicus DSM 13165]|uniref:Succinate--CoA ligase [ADP-forming] subunit alpha n=1 Tax=Ignicoccus islandicus DSM 13165 TaxID=940295 RepID=A0A0U3FLY9_9CREN|nr:succinate--CoA ligase subunit alpha [Ignicoccus islandicus]ALU11391.1 succinyl-CoA synthetase subunit alpha [Ignicoccus islandicus DSM 13165]